MHKLIQPITTLDDTGIFMPETASGYTNPPGIQTDSCRQQYHQFHRFVPSGPFYHSMKVPG